MNILKYVKLDMKATLRDGVVLLIEPPKTYARYEDGVKTEILGMSYTCLFESLNFEKFPVKIEGSLEPYIEYKGAPISVAFEELEGKLWQDFSNRGEVKLSLFAKNIMPVEDGKPRIKMNTSRGNQE